jgi:tetratricopeptide (TPR) repeat protein
MPLISSGGYPSLILKTRIVSLENVEESIPGIRQLTGHEDGTQPQGGTINKMLREAETSFEDFEQHGTLGRLEKAISQWKTALAILPKDDPGLPSILTNLGLALNTRFEQLSHTSDLEEAIEKYHLAVSLMPDDYLGKANLLNNLGNALRNRFERLGNIEDLQNAIIRQEAAIELTPDGDPKKAQYLSSLGASLQNRFQRLGRPADIDDAIARSQVAVSLTSDDHPLKHVYLSNLAAALCFRFQRFGKVSDVDDAIAQMRKAVYITPDDHPYKSIYVSNIGSFLDSRFERLGNISDLNDAIVQKQRAVDLISNNHPDKPGRLSNLGSALHSRFERLKNISDLNSSVLHHQAAIKLTPDSHPSKPAHLNNLGISLRARFERSGNLSDIDGAISAEKLAVNLTPEDHPNRALHFSNLGQSLQARFRHNGDDSDLDDAIIYVKRAVDAVESGHIDRPHYLLNLGGAFLNRFERSKHPHDVESAISNISAAAMSPMGSPNTRFYAAKAWSMLASLIGHKSLLAAYECALGLMPLMAWLGLPIVDRHQHLVKIGDITRDAAAAAISFEQYDKALEWLEQGRSIVWNQILQLRTPVDQLRDVNPDLAERLVQVSRLLDRGQDGPSERDRSDIEEEGRQYRALVAEWESIIEQVRSLPDFEDFLRSRSFYRLKNAAQNGPVVVINIAKERCDALALLPELEEVIHIPLPNISSERVTQLRDELKDQLYSNGIRMRGERAAERVKDEADNESCQRVLAELWDNLVKPVMDSLAFSAGLV